jgi:plastocyanin
MTRYVLALIGVAALIVAAGTPLTRPAHAAMMMGRLKLLAPTAGAVVTANTVPAEIAVQDVTMTCAWAGKANRAGLGHWHLLLDGALVNMYCGRKASLSLQNVAPGKHTITAVLAANNHMDLMGKGQMASATFIYRPSQALPALTAYKAPGKPSIRILAPTTGATVGERFQVRLDWSNFRPSCALLGKRNLAGYGHWHLNIDTMGGPMMGMGTMLAMGCTHTDTVFTDGLRPGRHKLYALLVDNQHAPLMPEVATSLTIIVGPGATAPTGTAQTAMIVTDPNTVGRYVPGTLRVHVGQSVLFKNVSDAAHTVTADNGAFDSGNIAQGASWRFTATRAGTFPYHCTYHPLMHGTIIVSE